MRFSLFLLLLVACGSGSDEEPKRVDTPTTTPMRAPICEKDDPRNIEVVCTEEMGLRTCRAVPRCPSPQPRP